MKAIITCADCGKHIADAVFGVSYEGLCDPCLAARQAAREREAALFLKAVSPIVISALRRAGMSEQSIRSLCEP